MSQTLNFMRKDSLIVSLIVGTTFFMENLDSTAISTAIPQMAQDFNVDAIAMSIGITAYVIMLAVFIPVSGWIADRFGVRTIFSTAISGFMLSSMLCGISTSLTMFVLARILQGVFGAMMVPVGQLAVLKNTAKKDLVTAIAFITWPGLAGPIIGPFLGGFFTSYFSWHWIFFINVPLGLMAVLFTYKFIPNTIESKKRPLDRLGFLLSSLGILFLMVGIELIDSNNKLFFMVASLFIAVLLLATNVIHSQKVLHPIIDYTVLKVRTYRVTVASGTLTKIVMNTSPYLLPLFFQIGFGLSAFNAGLLYMASMVGNLVIKPATIWITRKFDFRTVMTVNGTLLALSVFLQSFLQPETPYFLIVCLLFFSGMSRSMQFSSLNTLAYADIEPEKMSNANTLYNTFQQLSMALGIAAGAIFLHVVSLFHGHGNHYELIDFKWSLRIVSLLGILCIVEFFTLKKTDGLNVRNKK